MLASELVERLQKLIKEYGDLPVFEQDGEGQIHTVEFDEEWDEVERVEFVRLIPFSRSSSL